MGNYFHLPLWQVTYRQENIYVYKNDTILTCASLINTFLCNVRNWSQQCNRRCSLTLFLCIDYAAIALDIDKTQATWASLRYKQCRSLSCWSIYWNQSVNVQINWVWVQFQCDLVRLRHLRDVLQNSTLTATDYILKNRTHFQTHLCCDVNKCQIYRRESATNVGTTMGWKWKGLFKSVVKAFALSAAVAELNSILFWLTNLMLLIQ